MARGNRAYSEATQRAYTDGLPFVQELARNHPGLGLTLIHMSLSRQFDSNDGLRSREDVEAQVASLQRDFPQFADEIPSLARELHPRAYREE